MPSSSAATVECGRDGGGYNGYIGKLSFCPESGESASEAFALSEPTTLGRILERRLGSDGGSKFLSPAEKIAEVDALYATMHLLSASVGQRVVHRATAITELGMKARIITVPPAHLFAKGDLVRQVLWPALLSRIPQILPYAPHTEDSILRRLSGGLGSSHIFVSADLTRATDGFGHDAIEAVVDGIQSAGLPAFLCDGLRESLGIGSKAHFVSYELSMLSPEEQVYCRKHYQVVDGRVEVAKNRGSLMGTPCSFSILSLLNHWMSENLGPRRIICGDDLAALTHPDNVSLYAARAADVGSELHKGKSYRSRIGFVFCEAYALLDKQRSGLESFRPASLKEFVRNGNGVMSQHSVDPSSFNRLARCAKTIYRTQRKIAMKKHRPAELPAALGGLGHPCKGRLRVPKWCRDSLWELYLCQNGDLHTEPHDPTKYIRTLQLPATPSNRKLFKELSTKLRSRALTLEVVEPQFGDGFVPYRAFSAYVSIGVNLVYLNGKGTFRKVRPEDIKVGKLKWPRLCSVHGSLSTHTRIAQVLEWDRLAREERGYYFPPAFSAHVRGRTSAYRDREIPGDDRC
jgi:hypothetical protein